MNNVVVGIAALSVGLLLLHPRQGSAQHEKEQCERELLPQRAINGSILPFLALLYSTEDIYICGGSMIHYRMVLTAAHCLEDNTTLVVRFGDDLSVNGEKHAVDMALRHPLYDPQTHDQDLAILRLTADSLTCLWLRPGRYITYDYIVAAWVPSEKDSESVELKDLEVQHQHPSACGEVPSSRLKCVGNSDGNQCNVVSGGPLVAHTASHWPKYQVGIASYSPEQCRNATVYTRLGIMHTLWINRMVQEYGNITVY